MIRRNLYAVNPQSVMGMLWYADGLALSYTFSC